MAVPVAQSKWSNVQNASNAISVTLTSATGGSGYGYVVMVAAYDDTGYGATGLTLTNTGGTGVTITKRQETTGPAAGASVSIWTMDCTTAPTSLTATVSSGGGTALYFSVSVQEFSNVNTSGWYDTGATTDVATALSSITVSVPAHVADVAIVGAVTKITNGDGYDTPTGYTLIHEIDETNATNQGLNSAYKTFTASGTDTPTWTFASGTNVTAAAAAISIIGGAGGGGGGATNLMGQAML